MTILLRQEKYLLSTLNYEPRMVCTGYERYYVSALTLQSLCYTHCYTILIDPVLIILKIMGWYCCIHYDSWNWMLCNKRHFGEQNTHLWSPGLGWVGVGDWPVWSTDEWTVLSLGTAGPPLPSSSWRSCSCHVTHAQRSHAAKRNSFYTWFLVQVTFL